MNPDIDNWEDIECVGCHKIMCMSEDGIKKYGRELKCWDCLMKEAEGLRIWKDVALASKDAILETTHKLDRALEFLRDMQWQYEPIAEEVTPGKHKIVKTWYCPICDALALEGQEKKHNPDCTLNAFLKDNEEKVTDDRPI